MKDVLLPKVPKPSTAFLIRAQVQRYARMTYWVGPEFHGLVWDTWEWYKRQLLEEWAQDPEKAEAAIMRWFYDEWYKQGMEV